MMQFLSRPSCIVVLEDMSSLGPQRKGGENVLNGIALGSDHVLLTGKYWDGMYKVVFPDWESLFDVG